MDVYDIAGRTYGGAGEAYGLSETMAGVEGSEASFKIGKGLGAEWEKDWSTLLGNLPPATGG